MWWAWMLAGAGVILLLEIGVIVTLGLMMGKEIHEEREYWDNVFYPAEYNEEVF